MEKNNLSKEITTPDINDLQGLVSGCTNAIVVHGLREDFGQTNKFKMCKMVILYDHNELDMETIKAGADQIMMRQSFNLVKSSIYRVLGNVVSRSGNLFKAILFRNILGYIPNDQVHDDRKRYNDYLNGRA